MSALKRKFTQPTGGAVSEKKARVAKAMKKKITNMVLLRELKVYDIGLTSASVTTTPQVYSLTDIPAGDAYNQRNGNLVQSKYIQYEFAMKQHTGSVPVLYKLAIVLDRQCNGFTALYSDVFATAVSPLVTAMKNVQANQERFKIMHEHFGVVPSYGSNGEQGSIKGYIDMSNYDKRDQVIRWITTGAAAAATNQIYIMLVTDTATANQVSITGTFRYAFNEN